MRRFGAKIKYCEEHPFVAWHNITAYVTIYIHGFQYSIDDYAIGKVAYGNADDPKCCNYFRRKIMYTPSGRPFLRLREGRYHLDEFIRSNVPMTEYTADMKSLRDVGGK